MVSVTSESYDAEHVDPSGSIQPFGFFLALNAEWIIIRASENVADYLGAPHGEVIGRAVESCLSRDLLTDVRTCLQAASVGNDVECLFGYRLTQRGRVFDVSVHRSGREAVLEFEASCAEQRSLLGALRAMVLQVERQTLPLAPYYEAARQIRAFTGFEHVMVYRFDDDVAGEIVGEAMEGRVTPSVGVRRLAVDIPLQARERYERNRVQIVADVNAVPVPVSPWISRDGEALDLSKSVLRSVSPDYIECLKNKGVRASMSIALLNDGKLWGLIVCHHNAPRMLSLETRSTVELLARILPNLMDALRLDEMERQEAPQSSTHKPSSAHKMQELLEFAGHSIAADGFGIFHGGEAKLTGLTPTRDEFCHLVCFLNNTASDQVFLTRCLSSAYPAGAGFVARTAGILSIPISRTSGDYLIFFRRQETMTGPGEKGATMWCGLNRFRLITRKRFGEAQHAVPVQCAPWSKRDLQVAEELRAALAEVVLAMNVSAGPDPPHLRRGREIPIAELGSGLID